ncbi:Ankyrin repeat protein, partial [Globisporangium splendens]
MSNTGLMDMPFDHLAISETIRQGNIATLLRLLTSRTDDDHHGAIATASLEALHQYRDPQERSLAHLAIQANSLDVLEFVLASGFDATDDCEDETGKSPLMLAVLERNVDAVKVLLTYDSDINQQDADLHTPLHMLAMYSSTSTSDTYDGDEDKAMIELILRRNGADVHMRDSCGNTPLHLTAAYGACAFVRDLIRAGADVNAVNQSGSSPLHLAAANGEYQIVRFLLEAGADVNMTDAAGNTPLIDAAFVNQPPVSTAPTHFAFGDQRTQGKVVQLLLAHGADPNAVNLEGNNALFGAVRNQFEDVIDQLSHHDHHTTCFQWRNNQQETLLHVAARAQVTNVSIWQTLLRFCEAGSVSAFDRFERSCLSIWLSRPWSALYTDRNEHDAVALVSETALGYRSITKMLLAFR